MWSGVSQEGADNMAQVLTGLLTLAGASAPATAAAVVRKQNKQGAFETSPMENVVSGVTQVVEAQQKADQEVERVKDLLSEAVSNVPMLGPVAANVIDDIPSVSQVTGSLTSQILRR
jgi:hypothetical protein